MYLPWLRDSIVPFVAAEHRPAVWQWGYTQARAVEAAGVGGSDALALALTVMGGGMPSRGNGGAPDGGDSGAGGAGVAALPASAGIVALSFMRTPAQLQRDALNGIACYIPLHATAGPVPGSVPASDDACDLAGDSSTGLQRLCVLLHEQVGGTSAMGCPSLPPPTRMIWPLHVGVFGRVQV